MRRTAPPFLLLLAAACSDQIASAPARRDPAQSTATAPSARFALVDPAASVGGRGERNVFAFRERPVPIVVPPHHDPPVIPTTQAEVTTTGEVIKHKPEFPYHCIGRFGPRNAQLAAFVIDGEVKLAHAGETLADRYLVRAIGLESVEVAMLGSPDVSWTLDIGK